MNTTSFAPLLLLLAACSAPSDTTPATARAAATTAPAPSSLVLAEPLPGRRVKVSLTARGQALHIVNCNQHIVVALTKRGSDVPVWGGGPDARLSSKIAVPAGTTREVMLSVEANAPGVDTHTPCRAHVFGLEATADPASAPVAAEQTTSNTFLLLP